MKKILLTLMMSCLGLLVASKGQSGQVEPILAKPTTEMGFSFTNIKIFGENCQGQHQIESSDGSASFTVYFDNFVQTYFKGLASPLKKYCAVIVNFEIEDKWQVGLLKLRMKGFYNLSEKATGNIKHLIFFQGETASKAVGGKDFVYDIENNGTGTYDETISENIPWSPCNTKRGFTIYSTITLKGDTTDPESTASIGIRNLKGELKNFQAYDFVFRKCES